MRLLGFLIGKLLSRPAIALIEVIVGPGPQFSVRDRGTGVALDDLPHVFDRFWRGRGSGARSGTGIGLATVSRIVERHGGRARAYGETGRGATIHVFLPDGGGLDE